MNLSELLINVDYLMAKIMHAHTHGPFIVVMFVLYAYIFIMEYFMVLVFNFHFLSFFIFLMFSSCLLSVDAQL